MIVIDGSKGEGGGQMIRSSLALSMLTQTPLRLERMRAGRAKPGLKQQHLTGVRAAASICDAEVEGDELQSQTLTFAPGEVRAGDYHFDIRTAGSATLVLQTILPPLLLADEASRITLTGGTHNPFAPCVDFLEHCYLRLVNKLGVSVELQLDRHGFYPAGGGELECAVQPAERLRAFPLNARGRLVRGWCEARVANLPLHIAEREADTVRRLAQWRDKQCSAVEVEADGPGNVVLVGLEHEHATELVAAIGKQGVPAERVARTAWKEAKAFLDSGAAVGPHLADQWMLPLAIAAQSGDESEFTTGQLTEHSRTHVSLIQRFLNVEIEVEEVSETQLTRLHFRPRP